ncbi:MAG: glycosyltransferase, partial [bacterium]
MKDPLKVLYLARWYPNRYDPMPGLFIQRHAESASKCCLLGVVYTHVDDAKQIKGYELEFTVINKVPTARIYYNSTKCKLPLLSSFMKGVRFLKANLIGIRKIRSEIGGLDIIHVHILTRLGILALWYKWSAKVPYVISEHWSRYLSLTGDFKGFFRKWMTRMVVRNASVVTTVTRNLAEAMRQHGLENKNYIVLPNVEGMDFEAMTAYADQLGIDRSILNFTGLLEGRDLVNEMVDADLLVVFSNYENLPVVINEGFVLGVPVVATKVGGIPEIVNDNNGIMLSAGDEKDLENRLNQFLDGKFTFDNERISIDHQKMFSPDTLG